MARGKKAFHVLGRNAAADRRWVKESKSSSSWWAREKANRTQEELLVRKHA